MINNAGESFAAVTRLLATSRAASTAAGTGGLARIGTSDQIYGTAAPSPGRLPWRPYRGSPSRDGRSAGLRENARVKGVSQATGQVRARLGAASFQRVAGPQGPGRRTVIHQGEGERWFDAGRPIRRVHGDSSMFIGGITALLLQSLHPLAMAAVAGHSGYRGDPWGRLQRTSYFLAVTAFGRTGDAQETIQRIRGIHQRVTGTAPDGRPYAASDPRLL